MSRNALIITGIILVVISSFIFLSKKTSQSLLSKNTNQLMPDKDKGEAPQPTIHPLTIAALRNGDYTGSDITIEQELADGSNYKRYIASYKSEGLTIYAFLTVPEGEKPRTGWPVIIFNHGFIPPAEYRTTERYIAYTDGFSRNGYIVFRSDYRGHGNSEGVARGGYSSNDYTIDILNALASVKKYKDADPNRIGMWGHSMGGYSTLRSMVVNKDIKAGVIWAGVVGSFPTLLEKWNRNPNGTTSPFPTTSTRGGWRQNFIRDYGTPKENPEFWNSISSNTYLDDISGPVQIHHGTADTSVPVELSEILKKELDEKKKPAELYIYEGDDHNLASNFGVAMDRSVAFFDKYVKGEQVKKALSE